MLVALVGSLALGAGLSACGSSGKSPTTASVATHSRTHTAASSTGTDTTTIGDTTSSSPSDTTTTTGAATTTASGTETGSSGSTGSGGAGLGGTTTSTTTTTTTTTSTSCTGRDCQDGSPTAPGSVPPVNGKCRSGYVYVAAQDGGPALCIPLTTSTTAATATQ